MDYSLVQAVLGSAVGISHLIVMYDVWCQYSVKLRKRIAENPYLDWPEDSKTIGGIGLFHVHGHQQSCLARYSPTFIAGAGQVEGEIIETLWRKMNLVTPSTRAMTLAHRQETMDDHMNDINFKKMIRLGNDLLCVSGYHTDTILQFHRSHESTRPPLSSLRLPTSAWNRWSVPSHPRFLHRGEQWKKRLQRIAERMSVPWTYTIFPRRAVSGYLLLTRLMG